MHVLPNGSLRKRPYYTNVKKLYGITFERKQQQLIQHLVSYSPLTPMAALQLLASDIVVLVDTLAFVAIDGFDWWQHPRLHSVKY